jgi:hypothetical protein
LRLRLDLAVPVGVNTSDLRTNTHPCAENRQALLPILALLRESDTAYRGGPWPGHGDSGGSGGSPLLLLPSALDAGTGRTALQARVARSRVLLGKDWRRWDWESILLLAEDTFRHPARLAEAAQRVSVGAGAGGGNGGGGRVSFLKRVCDPFRLAGADRGACVRGNRLFLLPLLCDLLTFCMSLPQRPKAP